MSCSLVAFQRPGYHNNFHCPRLSQFWKTANVNSYKKNGKNYDWLFLPCICQK